MGDGWRIVETLRAQKAISKAPRQVRDKYEVWKQMIEGLGPLSVRVHNMPGFKDHALIGNWRGCRSSSLSNRYRVIYSLNEHDACITVKRIGSHDY